MDVVAAFASRCHQALAADAGPPGREKVRRLLEIALSDPGFLAACLGPDNTRSKTLLHEDPALGFCVYAHVLKGSGVGKPHDHGNSWAVYGQAAGVTEMTEWAKSGPLDQEERQPVKPARMYALNPGTAVLYNEGVIHSTKRTSETRLIRITGCDLDKDRVPRDRYKSI